jgi:carboxylate-amine ligase
MRVESAAFGQLSRMSAIHAHAFGSSDGFTLGVEEELFLVDPVTGAQVNASGAVLERAAAPAAGRIERELHACQVELITGVCRNAEQACDELAALRRAVLATGTGLIGTGTHPAAQEGEAEITDRERYERIGELLGDAVATPVGGLHIHVAMPDPETAIRAFNGLRAHLPMLQALGANSPFRHGRDTGLASAREVTVRGWPRSGVPRAMADYGDFTAATERLVRAAGVPDYTWFWWKLRPHPRLGTVEIRALDAQTGLQDTAALAALTHCLAREAASAPPRPGPPVEVLEEAIFKAARFGTRAQLPDADGSLRSLPEIVGESVAGAREHAQDLGCEPELEGIDGLLAHGGERRQRDAYEIAGLQAVLRDLLRTTDPDRASSP